MTNDIQSKYHQRQAGDAKPTSNPQDGAPSVLSFAHVSQGLRHSIGVTSDGSAYSWGRSNAVGQLGRNSDEVKSKRPGRIPLVTTVSKAFVSHGCTTGSGHSALVDNDGKLWMAGCDRWQQLGLGSSKGGSSGYTWIDGKLWQDRFVSSPHVVDLMKEQDGASIIRDVALGGDHTLVLSSNQQDVLAFGKGGDGQMGLVGKPFVSAPVKSKTLSEPGVAAICAIQNCSLTLDAKAEIKQQVGKCRAKGVEEGIIKCIERARTNGLLLSEED